MRELQTELATTRFRYRSEPFIIRMWREDFASPDVEWRGRMQHVPSGEVRFFHDWETFIGGLNELALQIKVP